MASRKKTKATVQQELPPNFSGTITVLPSLRRNHKAPLHYSPVVDVRVTDRDVRLLSFIVPPADPDEIVPLPDGNFQLPILSQCEWVLPLETATQLVEALRVQCESLRERLEAAE